MIHLHRQKTGNYSFFVNNSLKTLCFPIVFCFLTLLRSIILFIKFSTTIMRFAAIFFLTFCTLNVSFLSKIQASTTQSWTDSTRIPRVFLLGDDTDSYSERLSYEYSYLLVFACNNSVEEASAKWVDMMNAIEEYSNQVNFNLKGLKLWINIYWDKDGTIKHIAYHLRPESRNIEVKQLTTFLTNFCGQYKLPLTASAKKKFSHSGSTYFPFFKGNVGGN